MKDREWIRKFKKLRTNLKKKATKKLAVLPTTATEDEITQTIEFAKENMTYGLDASNFFLVMPLPGTPMFDEVTRNGQLPKNYNIDRMQWTKANMINTSIPPEKLEEIRQKAWEDCNLTEHIKNRQKWQISDVNTGEIHKGGYA